MKIRIDVKSSVPNAADVMRQVKFGTAVGLTRTAQKAQAAIVDKLRDSFTLRNRWFEKGNRYGIKIRPAKVTTMEAEVYTAADWLELHEDGGNKKPRKRFLAVPTDNVRRSKSGIIRKAMRPKNLVNSFLITTKSGNTILYQRKGKGKKSRLLAMYVMVPSAKIAKAGTFFEAAKKEIESVQEQLVSKEVELAIARLKTTPK